MIVQVHGVLIDNGFAKNVVVFGFGNNLLSHTDNCKNTFLVVGKGLTYGINGNLDSVEKKFSINFSKENKTFCLGLNYNGDSSYLFVNWKEII